ncbi:MAG: chemotaxis protein CheW, partial [Acidobacteriota bacterium]
RQPSTDLHPLPALPFAEPPPILGLAGGDASALPVLDLKQLSSPLPPAAPAPSLKKGAALPEDHAAALMLLPPLRTASDGAPITPAVSSAQVLGVEAAGEVTRLPSLPPWCRGVGWWLGHPVGVFDVAGRLAPTAEAARGGRWLIAAMPGGGRLALELDGRCVVAPLPERATVEPAPGPVGEAIYGLFRTAEHRLALLDLERWRRSSG